MKKLFRISLVIILLFGCYSTSAAAEQTTPLTEQIPFPTVEIIYNGASAGNGYIDENGRTLVNLRFLKDVFLCQASGYIRFCNISRAGVSIGFTIDENQMLVDENKIQIDTASRYFEVSSIYETFDTDQWNHFVPLRYVAEALDMHVDWDNENRQVIITEEVGSVLDKFKQIPLNYWSALDEYTGSMIIEKITSVDEYCTLFGETETYNGTFFDSKYILVIAWQEGSAGDAFSVADFRLSNSKVTAYIKRHNSMGGVMDVETSYTLAFEVSRELLDYEFAVDFIRTVDS